LSDGIHAALDNDVLAEVCGLCQNEDGFLRAVGADSGLYVTGCAKAPMKIDEAYADSVAAAGEILIKLPHNSGHLGHDKESFSEKNAPGCGVNKQ